MKKTLEDILEDIAGHAADLRAAGTRLNYLTPEVQARALEDIVSLAEISKALVLKSGDEIHKQTEAGTLAWQHVIADCCTLTQAALSVGSYQAITLALSSFAGVLATILVQVEADKEELDQAYALSKLDTTKPGN